nr:hypothetical protein [Tanacetum cinerariifolium]
MATFEALNELMEITGSTELHKRIRFWFVQEIAEEEGLLKFLRDRCDDLRRKKARRHVLICEIEALGERGVAVDSLESLKQTHARETAKLAPLTDAIVESLAGIPKKERHNYLTYSTGVAKPKKARKWKQPASAPNKESSLTTDDNIISDDPERLVTKKSTGKRKPTCIVIKDTPDVSKKKTPVQAQKHKGDFVHTPDDYVPTNDETRDVDDEEYDHINEEMYDDVNVELKDAELADKGKGNEEMTDAEKVNAEHEQANQEVTSAQVQDEALATTTAAPATQKKKTDVPPSSSSRSVSSNYSSIFLNLDNISSVETEIISTLDVQVKHENPKATTSTPAVPESETLFAIHLRVSDLEKEVIDLININHSTTLLVTIQSKVWTAVKEYLGTNLGDALQKVLQRHIAELIQEHSVLADVIKVLKQQLEPQKSDTHIRKTKMEHAAKQQEPWYTIKSSDKAALNEFDQKQALFETMKASKSFNNHPKHMALYHALIESILADEDAMDQGVADKQKKRKPVDDNRNEDPPIGPDQGLKRMKTNKDAKSSKRPKLTNQGLKRMKTSKDAKSSKRPKSTGSSNGNTSSQPKPKSTGDDMGTTNEQPNVKAALKKDWFKKPKRPPTPNPEWNQGKSDEDEPTQDWLSDLVKSEKPLFTFNELMCTPIDFSAYAINCLKFRDRCPFNLSKPLPLIESRGRQIIRAHYFFNNDLKYRRGGSTDRKYTTLLTKKKAAKYELKDIEDMVPTLWSPIMVAYDKHDALGTSHWGPKRQRFYGYEINRVSKHDVYSTERIMAVTNVKVNKWYGYGHLEEIEVRRADHQLYKFMEMDFPRLYLHDIEDMLLIIV